MGARPACCCRRRLYGDHVNRRGIVEPHLYSYTQGVMIGAGTLLYQATGNSAYLYQARQTAAAALAYFTPERLGAENPFFPSVYFRNLMYLDSVTHDPPGPEDRPGLRGLRVDASAAQQRSVRRGLAADRAAARAGGDRADLRAALLLAEHLLLARDPRAGAAGEARASRVWR